MKRLYTEEIQISKQEDIRAKWQRVSDAWRDVVEAAKEFFHVLRYRPKARTERIQISVSPGDPLWEKADPSAVFEPAIYAGEQIWSNPPSKVAS